MGSTNPTESTWKGQLKGVVGRAAHDFNNCTNGGRMIGSTNSNESTWRGKLTRRLGGINDQAVVGGVDPQGPDAAPTHE